MSKDRIRILLVEDSPSDARLLCESLQDYPLQKFDIAHAERLGEAIALLAQNAFDVVLQDLNLPDSQGMQTCERMVRAAGQVPVIVLTGANDEATASEAMRLGVQDYLVKGQSQGSVIGRTVRYAVERSQAQQALRDANERLQDQAEELQTQAEELTTANEELRDSEQTLGQRNKFLNSVLESLTHPFYVVDAADHRIITANAATGLKDRSPDAKCYSMAHRRSSPCPEADPDHPCPLEEVKRTGKPVIVEHIHYDAQGNPRNVEVHAYPLFDEQGRVIQMIEYCLDITERKQAEEALRELTRTLEKKVAERTLELEHRAKQLQKLTLEVSEAEDRERKRMAEILHDDLQQVLAAAKFHLGLMRNRARYDASVQTSASRIDHMLTEAIEKSRSLSHELSPAVLHHGDFTETLDWLANQVQAKHGLVVHVHARGQVGLQTDALKGFLYKATQELLFNVVKHARVSEAHIRVRRLGRCVCLSVADRGRGFDPHGLREAAGFGLLSIRERVELLGGRMRIKSASGMGSAIHILVPDGGQGVGTSSWRGRPTLASRGRPGPAAICPDVAGGSEWQEKDTPAPGREPCIRRRLRVLLADDHEIVREGLASLLGDEPAVEVVGAAANGREAVDLAVQLKPDVIVMDVSMPLINGDEATRQIKAQLPRTRVIALSMYEQPETREAMYRAGAEDFVLKTAPSDELLAAILGNEPDARAKAV